VIADTAMGARQPEAKTNIEGSQVKSATAPANERGS